MTNPAVESVLTSGKPCLLEREAKAVCRLYGIWTPNSELAHDRNEAVKIAERIGYPVVMKISSVDILHKSDAGGVVVGLNSLSSVLDAYDKIIKNALQFRPGASIDGVLIEQQVPKGVEVIVGAKKDPQFGHVVIVGLGGVSVELFSDFSSRIVPFSRREAVKMIHEMKAYRLLAGWRGTKPKDTEALAGIIMAVANLVTEHPEIEEIDLNPVMIYEKGAIAVDSRISLHTVRSSNRGLGMQVD
jgi:acetyl-CoA synthetase (ADP-forming)